MAQLKEVSPIGQERTTLAARNLTTQDRGQKLLRGLALLANYTLIILLSVLFALPFIWTLTTSLKTDAQIYHVPPIWIPDPIRWMNYPEALTYVPFGLYFINTIKYGLLATIGATLSSSFVAYGFSRIQWRGRNAIFFCTRHPYDDTLSGTHDPAILIFHRIGWLNTYLPLIVPTFMGSAYFIFMLRQFFLTIPMEISDAALIDGANEVTILWKIILPLATPALAVVALFQFMEAWNDYLGPLIYLRDSAKFPIAMGLEQMRSHSMSVDIPLLWPRLMAASAVITLPIVLLYFFTQRVFVEGITLSGVKG